LFVGGTSINEDIKLYTENGARIIVGTPGRILDMKNRCGLFNFKTLEVLVLDEADRLLDMGFQETINQILSFLPKQRRTGLFSATQTKEVKELARVGMRNPVSICVRLQQQTPQTTAVLDNNNNKKQQQQQETQKPKMQIMQATPSTLTNYYMLCDYENRPQQLASFFINHQHDKIIVFCATCACVDYYSLVFHQLCQENKLLPKNLNIIGFHGKMIPKKRNGLYKKFLQLDSGVMISTDVAARGIDIPDVDWIVQLTAPKDPSFFVHRVGRTARAGKIGLQLFYFFI
jgi:ATP-dependent RNA helicase DDX55/SPB4